MKRPWFLLLATILLLAALPGPAQNKKKEPPLKTVRGQVVDKEETPLPTAVVYLKNMRTQDVKTHIADDQANFSFSGLDPNVDYQIHAEHHGMSSAKRTISSFDNKKEIVLTLKVNRK